MSASFISPRHVIVVDDDDDDEFDCEAAVREIDIACASASSSKQDQQKHLVLIDDPPNKLKLNRFGRTNAENRFPVDVDDDCVIINDADDTTLRKCTYTGRGDGESTGRRNRPCFSDITNVVNGISINGGRCPPRSNSTSRPKEEEHENKSKHLVVEDAPKKAILNMFGRASSTKLENLSPSRVDHNECIIIDGDEKAKKGIHSGHGVGRSRGRIIRPSLSDISNRTNLVDSQLLKRKSNYNDGGARGSVGGRGVSGGSKLKRARANGFVGHSYCYDTNPLLPSEMIEHLRKGNGYRRQIVHVEKINARKAVHVEIPDELSETSRSALKRIGVSELYSHQADSIKASLSGKNVVVATMTSSGKSLCYNIPVLEALSQNLSACALYLFPTKALAQDQVRALSVMLEGVDLGINMGVYDGDTSQADRTRLRHNARLLVTNPDMLHMSILPIHSQFCRILSNLRYVVVDEAHAYKGAFGCHTALILRRLRRLCNRVYKSDPSFTFSTATLGNPREHVMELAGLSTLEVIKNDGSPSAPKLFVLWNPPQRFSEARRRVYTNDSANTEAFARRSSPILEVSRLFAEMVQHGLRCIAFCKTRKLCELVLSRTHEILQGTTPHLVDSICAYRAGYTAQDRRRIEREFFGGKLCGVAATNALELGIDVGHIDATLHLGFPGSISSLWQQAGRSGRRERPSLAIYIAFEGPLDQYFMKFPKKLFKSPIECCHIDAQNKQVLEQHLVCAAAEHPLSLLHDEKYFGSGLRSTITALTLKKFLSSDPFSDSSAKLWRYIGHVKRPANRISIRAIETEKYKVVNEKRNEVLEEIEESRAFFQVYTGAVYMHQGKTYLVKDLNVSDKIALCQEADLEYYTMVCNYTDIRIIDEDIANPAKISETKCSKTTSQVNNCEVTTTWFEFDRMCRKDNTTFETIQLSLPKYTYESHAVWIRVPQITKSSIEIQNLSFRSGLHAAAHALCNVVPLYIRCNCSDLGSECTYLPGILSIPERILLYDQHPGGSGISAQVRPLFRDLLTAALDLLKACCCNRDDGCPSCVQIPSCQAYNVELHKGAAIMMLQGLIDVEESHFRKCSESSETRPSSPCS